MKRDFLDYVEDIVNVMSNTSTFIEGITFVQFQQDQKTAFAAVRALEIIGEAVKKVPRSVRDRYPEIPWKDMAGMRDKLIHEYFGVNLRTLWDTIKKEIPKLKPQFERILRDHESSQPG